ncbi:PDC sensor domain-containing protein [Oceanibium sediminis]|uniref:PDC sensor domain-containing protein n=1 Tax=Oceanibium sediminis TaxID=2026339 RepID=UPI000DD2D8BA|nr:PDC sensor domain-containing protein [Oceanibium sediminis]
MSFRITGLVAGLVLAAQGVSAGANEFEPQLRALAAGDLARIAAAPVILDALRAQNAAHAGLSQADVEALDAKWRAEVGAGNSPLIDGVIDHAASAWLRDMKEEMGGLITEVFVVDAKGLNVAQSDVTSDYWQGDEDKWKLTYAKSADTVQMGEVELDESTQAYQSQVSFPINDPDTGDPLGTVTVGVNLEQLQ